MKKEKGKDIRGIIFLTLVVIIAGVMYLTDDGIIPEEVVHKGVVEEIELIEAVGATLGENRDRGVMTVDGAKYVISYEEGKKLKEGMEVKYRVTGSFLGSKFAEIEG